MTLFCYDLFTRHLFLFIDEWCVECRYRSSYEVPSIKAWFTNQSFYFTKPLDSRWRIKNFCSYLPFYILSLMWSYLFISFYINVYSLYLFFTTQLFFYACIYVFVLYFRMSSYSIFYNAVNFSRCFGWFYMSRDWERAIFFYNSSLDLFSSHSLCILSLDLFL